MRQAYGKEKIMSQVRSFSAKMSASLWHMFLFAVDCLVLILRPKPNGQEGVLIVKPDKLGDFIVWLDSAREYRHCFKGKRLVLIAESSWAALAEALNMWDEVIPVNFAKFGDNLPYRLSTLSRIRKLPLETAVSVSRSLRYADTLIRIASAPTKIGTDGNEGIFRFDTSIRIGNRWFTQIIEIPRRKENHVLQTHLSFMRALGCSRDKPAIPEIILPAQNDASPPVKNPYAVFVLGAASTLRRWPVWAYVGIADELFKQTDLSLVLCGTPAEIQLGVTFLKYLEENLRSRVINLIGKTDLVALVNIMANARFVVTNETGSVHLAAAVGTPVICIAGGGDFGHLVPYPADIETKGRPLPITIYRRMDCYGCGWRCMYRLRSDEPAPCIAGIGVKDVWTAVEKILTDHQINSKP